MTSIGLPRIPITADDFLEVTAVATRSLRLWLGDRAKNALHLGSHYLIGLTATALDSLKRLRTGDRVRRGEFLSRDKDSLGVPT